MESINPWSNPSGRWLNSHGSSGYEAIIYTGLFPVRRSGQGVPAEPCITVTLPIGLLPPISSESLVTVNVHLEEPNCLLSASYSFFSVKIKRGELDESLSLMLVKRPLNAALLSPRLH